MNIFIRYRTYEYVILCINVIAKNSEISDWNTYTHNFSHQCRETSTIGRTVLKKSDNIDILGVTFDSNWGLLRSIFDRFPEQLIKSVASWRSPAEYFMIDYSLGDALGVLSYPFWISVVQCDALLPKHTINYWTESSVQYSACSNWGCFVYAV